MSLEFEELDRDRRVRLVDRRLERERERRVRVGQLALFIGREVEGDVLGLLVGTVFMLAFGYAGETGGLEAVVGFDLGLCGWFYILFEIFRGEASRGTAGGGRWAST